MAYENSDRIAKTFLFTAVLCLIAGLIFGLSGELQYVFPLWLRDSFPFTRLRPLHVSLVITWIFTASSGGIYYYLPRIINRPIYSIRLAWFHYGFLILAILLISGGFIYGNFGGREYLEFPPWIGIIVLFYWTFFLINFFATIRRYHEKWPVYLWMWSVGLIFFAFTFLESQLWIFPYFRDNIIRDTTIQWKALGSMVGSWNMLVYGTAFYIMEKVNGKISTVHARKTFFFFFLGLTNMMFNWGHHTYIVPASSWIKNVSYIISMTELLIIGNIIYSWKKTLSEINRYSYNQVYRFLSAADIWIFLNLLLAILLSIPAVNLHTHGTHITVAHAMGTTIGINTMILLASLIFIRNDASKIPGQNKILNLGFWVTNISLLVFWISLLCAGYIKSIYQGKNSHQEILSIQLPWFYTIAVSGFIILIGIILIMKGVYNKQKPLDHP